MKSLKATALIFFASSIGFSLTSHAVDSSIASSADMDYCKVSYVDKTDGREGVYRGQCQNNKPHGSGSVDFNNGAKLTGTFEKGRFSGDGTYRTAAGDVYQGDWSQGKRHGQGTYTWAQGSHYEGEWIDDKREGQGVFTWANGNRFEGEFRDNKRYNGKYYTSTGRIYKCRLGQCR
ncbi:MORN repeat-containing protein [Oceanicoccus sp. KOV_DT_Chl]|uniref:MORN repeat-containing protein n=1 Tax=Oceanicoccus sp. KOV_DT_Chl TaxID=1904639 RepID=UPI000C7A5F80|nr:hypothetical protein [Oceanicoccus sp. KOV_DT_Chl]